MKFWIKTTLAILPALMLLGCGTSGEVQEGAEGVATSTEAAEAGAAATTTGVGAEGAAAGERMEAAAEAGFVGDPLDDPNSLLAKRVIYFDYDKSDVRDEFRDVVQAHAEYLANNPGVSITLEGHCDERGTREYNIALGERRANAVQRMLTLQGASANQVRVVSYGEERPAALGHDEDAWSLNRRAEFIYSR
jgi:peptidoglycan-associated lipoprotein